MSQVETPLYDVHMKGGRNLCLCKILIHCMLYECLYAHGLRLPCQNEGQVLRELVDLARTLRLNKLFEILEGFVCIAVKWLTLGTLQGVEREKYGM